MLKHIQETIVQDVQDTLDKHLKDLEEKRIQELKELIEVTIHNAFWKHGISIGAKIRTY